MSLAKRIRAWLKSPEKPQSRFLPTVRASYDAASDSTERQRHWANADDLSAASANREEIRKKLRRRARYEVANNCYAKGIILTLANYVVGTGPRLQLLTADENLNAVAEKEFSAWARRIRLAEKLHTLRQAKATDGESFALLSLNPALPGLVKLDVVPVECDRVRTPVEKMGYPDILEGVRFDAGFNPVSYFVFDRHPGDVGYNASLYPEWKEIPARFVLHQFRMDRPGQIRGVPEIGAALPLFADCRRYTLAVIRAAETAADHAMVIHTTATPEEGSQRGAAWETVELERGMATVLPEGYDLGQSKPEQPTTTYPDFKHEIINEIARCLNMPYNIAAGNSSGYNYASGRLDWQCFWNAVALDRDGIELSALMPILRAWLFEARAARAIPYATSDAFAQLSDPPHDWFWPGQEHVDPQKEATAQETRLRTRTATWSREYARQGLDWRQEFEQRAREEKYAAELGIKLETETAAPASDEPSGDEKTGEDEEKANARLRVV